MNRLSQCIIRTDSTPSIKAYKGFDFSRLIYLCKLYKDNKPSSFVQTHSSVADVLDRSPEEIEIYTSTDMHEIAALLLENGFQERPDEGWSFIHPSGLEVTCGDFDLEEALKKERELRTADLFNGFHPVGSCIVHYETSPAAQVVYHLVDVLKQERQHVAVLSQDREHVYLKKAI